MPINGIRTALPTPTGLRANWSTTGLLHPTVGIAPRWSRSTVGLYMKADGVLSSAHANQPRPHHYYINGTVVPAGFLVEPQRTNLMVKTNQLEHAYWTASNLTATDDDAVAPDGTTTATKLTEATDTASLHRIYIGAGPIVAGQTYCVSFYAKAGTRKQISWQSTSVLQGIVAFDLENGLAGVDTGGYSSEAWCEPMPNNWWRCCLKNTAASNGNVNFILAMYKDTTDTYNGNGSYLHVWGPQTEQGDAPTSYILSDNDVTVRGRDIPVYTGTDFTAIHTAANTIVLHTRGSHRAKSQTLLRIDDGTDNNAIILSTTANGYPRTTITSGSSSQFDATINSRYRDYQLQKTVINFGANKAILTKDGLTSSVDTSVTMPVNPNQLLLAPTFNGCIAAIEMYGSQVSTIATQGLSGTPRTTTTPETYKPSRIICDGNSLTFGYGSNAGGDYPGQLRTLIEAAWDHAFAVYNLGVSGQTIDDMNTDRVAQVHPLIVDGETICIIWEGANGLNTADSAADNVAAHWVYADAVRALGAKVIVGSCLPRNDAGTTNPFFEDKRQTFNALLFDEWQDHADAYADIGAIPEIGHLADTTNTDYYTDLVHMLPAGYLLVANEIYKAIQRIT